LLEILLHTSPKPFSERLLGSLLGILGSFFDFFPEIGFVLSEAEGIRRFPWSSFYEILPFPKRFGGFAYASGKISGKISGKFSGKSFLKRKWWFCARHP